MRGAYSKLSTAIGSTDFDRLSSKCTVANDIPEQLAQLKMEGKSAFLICSDLGQLDTLNVWSTIKSNKWWFDESYLGEQVDYINEFFDLIDEYSRIPRSRGSGHRIEAWVRSRSIDTKYAKAMMQLDSILANEVIEHGLT